MRVVVTGGAGFIGSNLCRRLIESEGVDSVSVIDDLSNGSLANLDGVDVTFVQGTILDDEALDRAFKGADAVVHLAALGSVPRSVANPLASHEANATGTLMVLEAARRHGNLHTIVASSSSVYGSNPVLPKHEDLATRPLSPYGGSKLATEGYALAWGSSYDLPVLAFRFFNVFGPMQPAGHVYAAVIPAFVDAALRGEPVTVHGDGTQSRDFTYVGTVCAAITEAISNKTTSAEPVNLAFGKRITLLETLETLETLLGHPIARNHIANRAGDVPHSQADNTRLRALLPDIEPEPFTSGLEATIAWMRAEQATQA
ncbi:MAG: NAD-dependent epimerase/dehydratase family protein [Ilumatobacteraceae bacterium]|nr:NAD-dependent epimerase/dehydratase family protein [Ilumatobacteraceae bacterium]